VANLLKKSKRSKLLPRIVNGNIWLGERYAEQTEADRQARRESGTMPPMMFTLDVAAGSGEDRVEYQLQLTEDEMIGATGEWLSKLASRRARQAKFTKERTE